MKGWCRACRMATSLSTSSTALRPCRNRLSITFSAYTLPGGEGRCRTRTPREGGREEGRLYQTAHHPRLLFRPAPLLRPPSFFAFLSCASISGSLVMFWVWQVFFDLKIQRQRFSYRFRLLFQKKGSPIVVPPSARHCLVRGSPVLASSSRPLVVLVPNTRFKVGLQDIAAGGPTPVTLRPSQPSADGWREGGVGGFLSAAQVWGRRVVGSPAGALRPHRRTTV